MKYLFHSPALLRLLYPSLTWQLPGEDKTIYLSFDDGPHETATPFVLDTLQQYNAKGTFFCIGKNVEAWPHLYRRILEEGHRTGNHTFQHLNGWQTKPAAYLEDIARASQLIGSNLFRPPYGRISRAQARLLQQADAHPQLPAFKIVMWSVLSGDFDTSLSPGKCLQQVIRYTRPGAIVVFHDSTKAWDRLQYVLPRMLDYFSGKGFAFQPLFPPAKAEHVHDGSTGVSNLTGKNAAG